jgi:hypothetical protein
VGFVFSAAYNDVVAIFDGLTPVSAAGILLLVDPVSEGVEVVVASSQPVEAYCCCGVGATLLFRFLILL